MDPIKFSATKLLRAWGPPNLICLTLFVLLVRPVIELWSRGEPSRSLVTGAVVVVLSGLMLALTASWLLQIWARKGVGVRDCGDELVFFGHRLGRFETVAWTDLIDVAVVRAGLSERIALTTRAGRQHLILSNVMVGRAAEIADKIRARSLVSR